MLYFAYLVSAIMLFIACIVHAFRQRSASSFIMLAGAGGMAVSWFAREISRWFMGPIVIASFPSERLMAFLAKLTFVDPFAVALFAVGFLLHALKLEKRGNPTPQDAVPAEESAGRN